MTATMSRESHDHDRFKERGQSADGIVHFIIINVSDF